MSEEGDRILQIAHLTEIVRDCFMLINERQNRVDVLESLTEADSRLSELEFDVAHLKAKVDEIETERWD